jgi:phosphatidylglycerol---prolipoprotein diacylglyceryl transferase
MLPILYQSPDLILYSYPLFMGLGWGVGYQIFFARIPPEIPRRYMILLFWGLFIFSWLGAKLLFALTSPTIMANSLLVKSNFWMGGGFVFFGGLLGGLLFLLLYRLFSLPFNLGLLSAILPAIALGHAVGRIGCFLAGCCYGDLTNWWWGIHLHGVDRHPTQLLESLGLFGIGYYLLSSKKTAINQLTVYLIGYGMLRFSTEVLRGDIIRGQWGVLTPSQWISTTLILAGIFILLFEKNHQSR